MRATYGESHVKPAVGIWVELEDLLVTVFSFQTTIDDNILGWKDRGCVVRNFTGASAGSLDLLPLKVGLIAVLLHNLVDSGEV